MKNIKRFSIGVLACVLVFGSLFSWQVWAQSGKGNTIYLPWITNHTQSVDVSSTENDTSSLLKPDGEAETLAEVPLPDDFETLTPGQPYVERPRPSQAELEAMAEIHIPADAPYYVVSVVDHITDSRWTAEKTSTAIIGTVKTVHPARWNTPDGTRPDNPFNSEHPSNIFTEIDIEVLEVLKGDVQPGEVLTLIKGGGQVGEDVSIVQTYLGEIVEGETVLLYTDPITIEVPGNYWRFNERYTVDVANNTATNPNETRSLDDLRVELAEFAENN